MKRQAIITVEFDAKDYFCARAQEEEIRQALSGLDPNSKTVDIRFTDRRPRLKPRAEPPRAIWNGR